MKNSQWFKITNEALNIKLRSNLVHNKDYFVHPIFPSKAMESVKKRCTYVWKKTLTLFIIGGACNILFTKTVFHSPLNCVQFDLIQLFLE